MKIKVFQPKLYRQIDEVKIAKDFRDLGCEPIDIKDVPGYHYTEHTHPGEKLVVVLEGEQDVNFSGKTYHMMPGDRLSIPANVVHSAKIGPSGCRFFWSEKYVY